MIGGAALYILCFLGFLFTKSALVASVCGFVSGVATSGFWDASGYPAVQEAYPAAPWICTDRNQIFCFCFRYDLSIPGCS